MFPQFQRLFSYATFQSRQATTISVLVRLKMSISKGRSQRTNYYARRDWIRKMTNRSQTVRSAIALARSFVPSLVQINRCELRADVAQISTMLCKSTCTRSTHSCNCKLFLPSSVVRTSSPYPFAAFGNRTMRRSFYRQLDSRALAVSMHSLPTPRHQRRAPEVKWSDMAMKATEVQRLR